MFHIFKILFLTSSHVNNALKGLEICIQAVSPDIRASNTWANDLNGSWKINAKKCMSALLEFYPILRHVGKPGNPSNIIRKAQKLIKMMDSINDDSTET